jgi:hypothetical protein
MRKRFIWGTIAIFALTRHYAKEIRPIAEKRGDKREHVLAGAHNALNRVFAQAWPESDETDTTGGGE